MSALRSLGLALVLLGAAVPAFARPDGARATTLTLREAAREVRAQRAVPASWLPLPGSPDFDDGWEGDDWDWLDDAPPAEANPRKSLVKAVAWSALLPGLGERYTEHATRAHVFYVAEAAIWSTFAYYEIQGNVRRNSQVEFAQLNAGALGGQDDDYYEHIGLWLSLSEWHDIVRRDARRRFPEDPAAQEDFFQENKRYDQGHDWEWADDDERNSYRRLRSQTERSYRNARLAVGVAVVNRFVSMIDALGLARGHNRRVEEEESARLDLRIGPRNTVDGLVIGPILSARY